MPDRTVEELPRQPAQRGEELFEHSRSFTIFAGSETDAIAALAIDQDVYIGSVYTDHQGNIPNLDCVCVRINAEAITQVPTASTGLYRVTAFFSSRTEDQPYPNSPTAPAKWSVEKALVTIPAEFDRDGQYILNTADQPFSPAPTKLVVKKTLVARWTRTATSDLQAQLLYDAYEGKTNIAPYRGAAVDCLFLHPVEVEALSSGGGTKRYRFTGRFEYLPPYAGNGGWALRLLNLGTRVRLGTDAANRRRYSQFLPGSPQREIKGPIVLNSSGTDQAASGVAQTLFFNLYPQIDFNAMGI